MLAYYGNPISPNQIETVEGFLICKNVPIARTGEMEYFARELQLDGDPDRVVKIMRYEDDVFNPAAMASFEGKSVTDEHPAENLEPETAAAYTRGHVQNVRREGDFLVADLHIFDAGLINDVQNGVKREVSCGYTCQFVPDGANYKQTNIRGNHVAVVRNGRAGHEIAIKDEKHNTEKGVSKMANFKAELLKLFGLSAQGASPEELEKMTATASAVLDAMPEEKGGESVEDVMVERAPKGDDLGSKLDKLISMVAELEKKNDREEKKLSDESDLDKEIARLEGGEAMKSEEAVTVPAGKLDDAMCGVKTGDALSAEFLRKIRPAVANIKDPNERARVVDAMISSVRGGNVASGIFAATQDAAKASGTTKKSYEAICDEQKAAYDSMNPHKNKK